MAFLEKLTGQNLSFGTAKNLFKAFYAANLNWLNGMIFIYFRSVPINETK